MKKVLTIFTIFMVSMMIYVAPSHALGYNLAIETDNDVVTKGGTLTVTVSTKNFDFGSQGIDAGTGIIEYSTDVFEELTGSDIQGLNGWGISYNNGKILCVPSSSGYITEEGGLFSITFRVKSDAPMGDTQIAIKDFIINDAASGQRVETADVTKEISVKSISSNVYKFEGTNIVGIKPGTTVETFKSNIIGTGMTMKSGTETYTLIISGDLNGDGQITATDLAKIKQHLIELRLLEGAYLEAANVDGDEEVTITDLSRIRKAMFGEIEL